MKGRRWRKEAPFRMPVEGRLSTTARGGEGAQLQAFVLTDPTTVMIRIVAYPIYQTDEDFFWLCIT